MCRSPAEASSEQQRCFCHDVTIYSNSVTLFVFILPLLLATVWSVIHTGFYTLFVVGSRVLCWDSCLQSLCAKDNAFGFFCLHTSLRSISTKTSLVNKVHSVFQLSVVCVRVSISIQSISMGSMSYFVFCFSLRMCFCYLNTGVGLFVAYVLETVCLLCMYNPLQSASVCIWQSVRVCVCAYEEQYSLGC